MSRKINNLIFVWFIMLLTTMMTIMPLPEFFYGIRIELVALAVILNLVFFNFGSFLTAFMDYLMAFVAPKQKRERTISKKTTKKINK